MNSRKSKNPPVVKDEFEDFGLFSERAKLLSPSEIFKNCSRKKPNHKMQSKKSEKINNSEEKKTSTVKYKAELFLNICDEFENALKQLEIETDSYEEVLKKLDKIELLVKNKISSIHFRISENYIQKNKPLKQESLHSEYSISTQSLSSNSSFSEIYLGNKSFFRDFLINVNCPFCSMSQHDKVNLIKHLDESCKAHKQKKLEKCALIPYSVFQILSNNSFKCNVCPYSVSKSIKHYLLHVQSKHHMSVLERANKIKKYTNSLFCSCCKVQVFNTYIQINSHLRHDIHKTKSLLNTKNYLKNGINCKYTKSKKFKCLSCSSSQGFYQTPKEVLIHFKDQKHKNIYSCSVFCEVCSQKLLIFEVMTHFTSTEHKERENREESFELCFYCDFTCANLMELSVHMESECSVINDIRKSNFSSDEQAKKHLKEVEEIYKNNIGESKVNEGGSIVVKGYSEIPELFKYFKKFGEINLIEKYDENNITIKFQNSSAIEDILLFRDLHKINDVKIEITTEMSKSKEIREKSQEGDTRSILIENVESDSSCSEKESEEDKESSEGGDLSSRLMLQADQLQNIFQRVSSHLMKTARSSNSEKKIASDCAKMLGECNFVGFTECELSFPAEDISLNCEVEIQLLLANKDLLPTDVRESNNNNNNNNDNNLLKKVHSIMSDSELWEEVIICFERPFPRIKCKHKETQKVCAITFSKPARILTNMLRYIMKKNEFIRPFCLIIRFWLNVHDLKIKEFEYALISLLIYFLTSEKIVDFPITVEYNVLNLHDSIQVKSAVDPNVSSHTSSEGLSFIEMFHRFLLFINKFDFDNFCICLPLTYPVERKFLLDTFTFLNSSEMLNSPMCIIDPSLSVNLSSDISRNAVKSLKKTVNIAIKHYGL